MITTLDSGSRYLALHIIASENYRSSSQSSVPRPPLTLQSSQLHTKRINDMRTEITLRRPSTVEIGPPPHSSISEVITPELPKLQVSGSNSSEHIPEAIEPKSVRNVVSPPSKSLRQTLKDFGLGSVSDNDPKADIQVFEWVSPKTFEILSRLVEEKSLPQRRPKLSYNPTRRILIVELASPAHEISLTDFGRVVQSALDQLPTDRALLRTAWQGNLKLRSAITGFAATPDLALHMSPIQRGSGLLLAIVECAFSQSYDNLMAKIRDEVDGWPKIVMVVLILVSEHHNYHCPREGTPTWEFFSQPNAPSICLTEDEFFALPRSAKGSPEPDEDVTVVDTEAGHVAEPLVLQPVVVAGHTWCDIKKVEYHVWVKEDGAEKVSLDHNEKTIGCLYPDIVMDDAERVIRKGLSIAKDVMNAELPRTAFRSGVAARQFEEAELTINFDWKDIQAGLQVASRMSAWGRYQDWYFDMLTFRGTKRGHPDDAEYLPPEVDSASELSECSSSESGRPPSRRRRMY